MTKEEDTPPNQIGRILSIDVFKGLTILLMVFINTFQPYDDVPAWSKHAGEYGLTYIDLVAPFFVFMLALNMKISYKRRVEKFGKKRAALRFIRRFLIFIGIGLVLTIYVDYNSFYFQWGTLQVLGFSGLMVLPLLDLKPFVKLTFATIFMVLHQLILLTPASVIIYESVEGGILAVLSWGSMMILSSFLAEGVGKGKEQVKHYFLYGGFISLLIGIGTGFVLGVSRPYISLPYILISVGVASLLYYLLYFIFEEWDIKYNFIKKERLFSVVGKNAFMFYLIHILIAYTIYSIFPFDTPSIIIFPLAIVHTAFIWLMAYYMNKLEMFIVI